MPKDSISWDEFLKRMEGFDDEARRVVQERIDTNFTRTKYEFLSDDEATLLAAVLNRLIPQDEGENKVDLVGFMDWAILRPLGQGHRHDGLPDTSTLFHSGLKGLEQTAQAMYSGRPFVDLSEDDQDQVLRAVQEGRAEGQVWQHIPGSIFFRELLLKALAGYCAHPRIWARIGFYGPSFPEGYLWVSHHEVEARHAKKRGHLTY